ncbi:AraC family transcriptional regulator [Shewanella rhizosphaerae]|uniref:AraC family transcriptional regulator n=1 Tax=Shewanella rhizosphaerae TaxID=2864207 RepID=UPI001C65B621|nr:AraC family transcriptional regulator [Shewanella rhizosphaerae]QYK14318.1 AraC family transcriptional regulator [Shewanella rhizosphaerae]
MMATSAVEKIDYWQASILKEMELSRAQFTHFAFEKHVHLDYHIGVVCHGGQRYHHRGSEYRLTPGNISTLNPDESHNGQSIADGGYEALVMSLPTSYVQQVGEALNQGELYFSTPILDDPKLRAYFIRLHSQLTLHQANITPLEAETLLLGFISELFYRHGKLRNLPSSQARLSGAQLDNIKQQFHQGLDQEFELEQLALSVGLSKFQFLRQFKAATGMTPHAYLKRLRLEYAKKALMRGDSAISTAYDLGFFDQSHFNKAFKRAFLITPAHFQKRVTP